METEIDRVFEFDFDLSLKDKLETVWRYFPCINPLGLCAWRETDDGVISCEED